nr:hypothetical protein L204_05196 [Cryptococcus depauperatus CBS 7855]
MAAINFAPLYNNKANGFASISAQKVAETAATNRHALINLIRLIKSLESRVCKQDDARDNLANQWENVVYARALRGALRNGNEQSSTTASALADVDRSLESIELALRKQASFPSPITSINPALIALPMSPLPTNPLSTSPNVMPAPPSTSPQAVSKIETSPGESQVIRRRLVQLDEYLERRSRDATVGEEETRLLPLQGRHGSNGSEAVGPGAREDLLESVTQRSGPGASQIHEELSGELASMIITYAKEKKMSHQLKLNAIHFSTSLEREKQLIQDSQDTLESKLQAIIVQH